MLAFYLPSYLDMVHLLSLPSRSGRKETERKGSKLRDTDQFLDDTPLLAGAGSQ